MEIWPIWRRQTHIFAPRKAVTAKVPLDCIMQTVENQLCAGDETEPFASMHRKVIWIQKNSQMETTRRWVLIVFGKTQLCELMYLQFIFEGRFVQFRKTREVEVFFVFWNKYNESYYKMCLITEKFNQNVCGFTVSIASCFVITT